MGRYLFWVLYRIGHCPDPLHIFLQDVLDRVIALWYTVDLDGFDLEVPCSMPLLSFLSPSEVQEQLLYMSLVN